MRPTGPKPSKKPGSALIAAVCLFAAAGAGFWFWNSRRARLPITKPFRVTSNKPEHGLTSAMISPDGKFLAYSDSRGIWLGNIATRDMSLMSDTKDMLVSDWYPDSTHLRIRNRNNTTVHLIDAVKGSISLKTMPPGRLSPDGKMVLAVGRAGLAIMAANGENPHVVLPPDPKWSIVGRASWSPDERRIAMVRWNKRRGANASYQLEILPAQGGAPAVLIQGAAYMNDPLWLRDGRIVYIHSDGERLNLRAVQVAAGGDRAESPPVILTDCDYVDAGSLSATADGKSVFMVGVAPLNDAYIAELEDGGKKISGLRKLIQDEYSNQLTAWTKDGRAIVFSSNRNGNFDIFRQDIDKSTAALVAATADNDVTPQITADGFVLFKRTRGLGAAGSLMRVPLTGGTAAQVYPNATQIRCVPAGVCAIQEEAGGKMTISLFDPAGKKGRTILPVPTELAAPALSPDGTHVAYVVSSPDLRIRIVKTDGTPERDFLVLQLPDVFRMDWTPDGNGFLVSAGGSLYHLDLDGMPTRICCEDGLVATGAVPAPDGKRLAIQMTRFDSNVVMIEDF